MDPHLNIIYHCHHESSLCDHICRDPNPCHLSLSSLPTGQCRAEGKVYSIQDCGQVCHDNPCPPPLPKWLLSGQSEQTLDYNWGQTEEAHREVIHNECTIINGWLSLYKCISHSFMADIPNTSVFLTHLWLTFLLQVHFPFIYGWHSLYKCISHSFMVDIPYTSAFSFMVEIPNTSVFLTHIWLTFLIQVHSHLWLTFLIQVYFSLIYGWHS